MYVGKLFELAETDELFQQPLHPYTSALLSAIPKLDPTKRGTGELLAGEVADASSPPSGCYFHPRCIYKKDICQEERPDMIEVKPGHFCACHFAKKLKLKGIM